MIEFGVKEQMQDMYLYLREDKGVIQFRKNQEIASFKEVSPQIAQQLITRFKYLGEMDVGEHRRAQLGAISYPLHDEVQRLRLSTVGIIVAMKVWSFVFCTIYPSIICIILAMNSLKRLSNEPKQQGYIFSVVRRVRAKRL